MAFLLYNNQNGENFNVLNVLPANVTETFAVGEALKFVGGVVTLAAGTDKPEFLAARVGTAKTTPQPFGVSSPTDTKGLFPVNQIVDSHLYESYMVTGQAAPAIGNRLTISADGLGLMAAVGGAFEVQRVDTLVTGDIRVIGRFVAVAD